MSQSNADSILEMRIKKWIKYFEVILDGNLQLGSVTLLEGI